MKNLRNVLLSCLAAASVLPLSADDSAYYSERSNILGFQDFKSTLPNKTLPTVKEQMQHYRMASYSVPHKLSAAAAAKQAKWFKEAGFNMILAESCRMLVMDLLPASERTAKLRSLDDTIKDSKMIFDALKKEGIKTMHHVTCTQVPMKMLQLHPEWAAVYMTSGKTKMNWYGTGNTCINNDDFWKVWFSRLTRLLKESPADAVMIDEIQFFGPDLCGCKFCRKKFRKDTGYSLPENGKFNAWIGQNPAAFRRWRNWRIEKVIERQQECRKLLKSLNTEAVFSAYLCNILTVYTRHAFGCDISNLPQYADSIGLESMPADLRYPEYYPQVLLELKLLRGVSEKKGNAPWVLFYAWDSFSDIVSTLTAFATGTRQWWYLLGKSEHIWRPMLQWEMEHESLLAPAENAGNIAVYFSSLTRGHNPMNSTEWELGFSGLCNALSDEQIPYRVVVDEEFKDGLALRKKADTLVAMNNAVWSEKSLAELEKFIRNGGTLITSGNFSMADDNYKKLTDFAAAKLLGFNYDGEIKSASVMEVPQKNPVTGEFTGKIAYDKRIIKLKNIASDVKVYGSFIDKEGKSYPGILVREVGKGRIVYFAGSPERCSFFYFYNTNKVVPGQVWKDFRNPQWSSLLAKIVRAYNDKVVFEAKNFPKGVIIEALKHKNGETSGTMLTLVNFQSNRVKAGFQPQLRAYDFPSVYQNRPDKSAPMTLDIYAPGTKKVYLFSVDFDDVVEWNFVKNGDRVTVEIPELARHLVVYCSSGSDKAFAIKGRKIVKTLPAVKPLLREELPAIAAPRNPESVTIFSDNAAFSGGVPRTEWVLNQPIRTIYGDRSGKTEMSVTFKIDKAMVRPILEMGATCDDIRNSRAKIKIEFNGKTIFAGKAPYPDFRWAVNEFPLGVEKLEPGTYTVKITNTDKGPYGNVPWLGVAYCRLKPSGKTLDVKFDKAENIPVRGKFAKVNGKYENGGFRFGSDKTGIQMSAHMITGEEGAVALSFKINKPAEDVKFSLPVLHLRPASLASLYVSVSGKKAPEIAIGFFNPSSKKGKVLPVKQGLEFDKEYHVAAIWKDGKFRAYLDGKLLGEGDIPLAKVKFNDLFIGPFKDKYIHSFNKWSDSCLLTGLRVWNMVPEISEIFPEK
ncbi:MAG: hypothetical protein E7051_05865 [Lentisphaerae bacterium]|nr:hypothetical protein [Lentisphaerota bacterium]